MPKKILKGKIVSDKMDKTVVVAVDSYKKHPKLKKYFRFSKKYKAHDEKNECKAGDIAAIEECGPISKDKHFRILKVL